MLKVIRRDIDAFDSFLNGFVNREYLTRPSINISNEVEAMRIDVRENDDSYIVEAELPGVKKEDIKVSVSSNSLSISATVKNEKETKNEDGSVLRNERYYGSLSRVISFGQSVDQNSSEADYSNGLLTLVIGKEKSQAAKQLKIN